MAFTTSSQETEWALFLQPRSPHGASSHSSFHTTGSCGSSSFHEFSVLCDCLRCCIHFAETEFCLCCQCHPRAISQTRDRCRFGWQIRRSCCTL